MKIFKYELPASMYAAWAVNKVRLPQCARILKFGTDPGGSPCIWAIVNEDYPLETIDIYTFWTGADFPKDMDLEFFGTTEAKGLIIHAFTLKKEEESVKEETDRSEAQAG